MTTQRIQISSQIKKSIQDPDKKDTQVDETVNNLEEIFKNTKVSAEKKKILSETTKQKCWKLNNQSNFKIYQKALYFKYQHTKANRRMNMSQEQ